MSELKLLLFLKIIHIISYTFLTNSNALYISTKIKLNLQVLKGCFNYYRNSIVSFYFVSVGQNQPVSYKLKVNIEL